MRIRTYALALAAVMALPVALIGWISWRSSDAALPPLAQGLHGKFEDSNRVFRARIAKAYPVGSPEARLVADLERQGFEIVRRKGRDYSEGKLRRFMGCGDRVWMVTWHAEGGRLTKVSAIHGADCL